jgi:translation elongation factor EF-Tu-like GTPase
MTTNRMRVRARISLLPSEQSGRVVPIRGSYRPNHNFFGPDNREMATGFIEVPADQPLHPGESMEVEMLFWSWSRLEPEVRVGREWRIQEGPKWVGTGVILEILGGSTHEPPGSAAHGG